MEPSPETQADAIVEEESVKTVEASPGALPFMEETCSSAAKERQEEKGESEMKNGGGGDAPTCLQTQHTFEPNDFLWAKQSKRGIYWPARVAQISDKIPKQPSHSHQWIYFYDSDSFMWIAKEFLMDLEEGRQKNVAAGDKSKAFKLAFEKLEEERLCELSGTSPVHEKVKRTKATTAAAIATPTAAAAARKKTRFDSDESPSSSSRPVRTRKPVHFPGAVITDVDTDSVGSSGCEEDPSFHTQPSINEEDLALTPDRVLDMLDKQLDMVSSSKYTSAASFSGCSTHTLARGKHTHTLPAAAAAVTSAASTLAPSSSSSSSAAGTCRKRTSGHKSEEPRSKKSPAIITCSDFSNDGLQLDELNSGASWSQEEGECAKSSAAAAEKCFSIADESSPRSASLLCEASSASTSATSTSSSHLPNSALGGGGNKRGASTNSTGGGVAQIKPFRRTQPVDKNIGFIGVGHIGHNLVELLLTQSYNVFVWNKTPQKCCHLRSLGANTCISAGDVMSRSDVTFCCVSNVESVREVLVGTNGALNEMKRGKSFVNMTTSDPKTSTEFYQLIQMRGGRYLETPLLGSRKDSAEGSFLLLAAGDYTLYEEVLPCLELFSKKRSYVGAAGKACEMQLLMNLLYGNQLAVLAEVMALCRKSGVDRQQLLSVLHSSDLASPFLVDKAHMIVSGNEGYETVGKQLRHQQTDLKTVLNLSDQLLQAMPVTAACNELFKRALSWGDEELDMAAVYKAACL